MPISFGNLACRDARMRLYNFSSNSRICPAHSKWQETWRAASLRIFSALALRGQRSAPRLPWRESWNPCHARLARDVAQKTNTRPPVETHSCVSANRQAFAIANFIRQSRVPRRKNASLQLFVELTDMPRTFQMTGDVARRVSTDFSAVGLAGVSVPPPPARDEIRA